MICKTESNIISTSSRHSHAKRSSSLERFGEMTRTKLSAVNDYLYAASYSRDKFWEIRLHDYNDFNTAFTPDTLGARQLQEPAPRQRVLRPGGLRDTKTKALTAP